MTPLPSKITIGHKYGPAMQIETKEEADEYFEACVQHCMSFGKSREDATNIERQNIGYFAGYQDGKTRDRVYSLFGTAHPIFGRTTPTPEAAMEAGRTAATAP